MTLELMYDSRNFVKIVTEVCAFNSFAMWNNTCVCYHNTKPCRIPKHDSVYLNLSFKCLMLSFMFHYEFVFMSLLYSSYADNRFHLMSSIPGNTELNCNFVFIVVALFCVFTYGTHLWHCSI